MTVVLRDYQAELKAGVYARWQAGHRNVLAVAPTASGKTTVFASVLNEHRGASIAIAHRQELVSQISLALARVGVRHGLIAPDSVIRNCVRIQMGALGYSTYSANASCRVAGVDTLVRRDAADPFFQSVTLWVQDEAHHVLAANKWGRAASMFPNARGLGVTATPTRADGKGLGRHADGLMDTMVLGPSMRDLINRKYLTDYRIFVPPSNLDLSAVPVAAGGDYSPEPLRKAVHKSRIVGDVVQHYLRIARGKLGVTFAVDIESAQELAAAYRAAGVPAEVVTSETPDLARQAILTQFANRQILQLVNVDIFGEGFDLPAIEVVSFARPTLSYALYVQQFGRALRLLAGKEWAVIIDHVGNVHKHGLPDVHREWTLDARTPGRGPATTDAMPIKTCPQCESAYEAVLGACPYCSHVALPAGRSKPAEVQGDLYELSPEALAELRGEIDRVDGAVVLPWGQPASVGRAVMHRHQERQASQKVLRDVITYWGGMRDRPVNTRRAQVEFFRRFGVDVMTAQTLGSREASELTARILKDITC